MANASLTATFVLNKTRKDRLEDVRELNAWGQDVEDLGVLTETPCIEVLALACNRIRSLKQLRWCTKLRQLLLRKNQVSDITEVYHLTKLPDLQILSLSENPVCADPDYRLKVLAYLPRLQKLDDSRVTPDEVDEARSKFPDAPHGISQDGSVASADGGIHRTPAGPSPGPSPVSSPLPPPRVQSQTPPPHSRTPPVAGGYASGGPTVGPTPYAGVSPQAYNVGPQQGFEPQQPSPGQLAPPAGGALYNGAAYGSAYSGQGSANGAPTPPSLQQHLVQQPYLSPAPQQQPVYSTAGGNPGAQPQYQQSGGVPQYHTSGWLSGQASPPPEQQPSLSPSGGGASSSDNVFYAIVALLPELSSKHISWVKDEVDARLLELQQQQLNIKR